MKNYQWDGNGDVITLKVLGFIQLKNQKNMNMISPKRVRVITEPKVGFGGASTIIIDGDKVSTGRIYTKTLEKMKSVNCGEEFTDTSNKKWIKLNNFDFDQNIIYKEIKL